ncbi:MAG: ABC transporter substrate-binding protein [Pyrinomonadaceae bacterium]
MREALAISVNRARLCADVMDGATEPAERFLPSWRNESASPSGVPRLRYDAERARQLLSDAGYPGGKTFPASNCSSIATSNSARWPRQSRKCGGRRLGLRRNST